MPPKFISTDFENATLVLGWLLHRHDLHVVVVTILNLADVIDRLLTAAVTITHLLATVLEGIRQWVI
jgi:hypothetical protein